MGRATARRFRRLRIARPLGRAVPVAERFAARALGLAVLPRRAAGPGLLIPRCRSVHTFGMRFPLDVYFLDAEGRVVEARLAVGPGRVVTCRAAAAVLEVPAGGEPGPLRH